MRNSWDILVIFLAVLFFISLLFLAGYYFYNSTSAKYTKKRAEISNKSECAKVNRAIQHRNNTDFMWADFQRIKMIGSFFFLFFIFFIMLTLVTTSTLGEVLSIIFAILTLFLAIYYGFFAYHSFKNFESKAKERLSVFEKKIEEGIRKEISFDGDKIQHFSNDDEEFDTQPQIFSFPIEVTKINFPPFEKNKKNHKIISTRKLEFLVLSREYFSICKGAGKFDLLNPKQAPVPKKCAEVPGATGECHEYYYSQMQNVQYDDKEECIRIIYYGDIDDVTFACKKNAGNRKPAMKALKEKLRLTERQKLQKIQEHKDYEMIKEKRLQQKELIDKESKED